MKAIIREKIESAGHLYQGNVWIKIGLNQKQAKALRVVAGRLLKPGWQTSAAAARMLLVTALAHYDALEALFFQDQRYAKTEGFLCRDDYQSKLACRQLGIEPLEMRDGRSFQHCRIEVQVGGRWLRYRAACARLKQVASSDAANMMTARMAASQLRKVRAQFPRRAVRIQKTAVEGRKP